MLKRIRVGGVINRALFAAALVATIMDSGLFAIAQEVIDATAFGTSTQMGKNVAIKIIIERYSTPEDKKTIDEAFAKGQNQGLYDALSKMKSVGRIQIPGTLGYDISYVSSTTTPTALDRSCAHRRSRLRILLGNTDSSFKRNGNAI